MTATKLHIKRQELFIGEPKTGILISSIVAEGHRGHLADRYSVTQVPNSPSRYSKLIPAQRLAVFDGVTPRDSSLMYLDMASFATTVVKNRIYGRVNIPESLIRANNALYDSRWKTHSPASMCAIGDIYLDPNKTEFQLEGEFYAAGDCEIYLHRPNGWEMLHGKRMLADDTQKEFDKLLAEVKVFWDCADDAYAHGHIVSFAQNLVKSQSGDFPFFNKLLKEIEVVNDFEKLYIIKKYITEAMLIPREEALTAERDSYVSPPIGRYPTSTLDYYSFRLISPYNPTPQDNYQFDFDGVLICTDGAKIDVGQLNDQSRNNENNGDPVAQLPIEIFGKAHSGADRAIITLHIV